MKKSIVVILALWMVNIIHVYSQDIFSNSNSGIIAKKEYVNPMSGNTNLNNLPYVLKGTTLFTNPDTNYGYKITCEKYKGWENEPGDFHVLKFYSNNALITEFQNALSWVKIPSELRQYSNNDFFIPVTISNNVTALIFIGYVYESEPSELSIFIVKGNSVILVFNKKLLIQNIIKTSSSFSMILRDKFSSFSSYNSSTNIFAGNTYKIWLENQSLKFIQPRKL